MEGEDPDSAIKAEKVRKKYESKFRDVLYAIHPANLPGEVKGKGANQAWAAKFARRELVDRRGIPIEKL